MAPRGESNSFARTSLNVTLMDLSRPHVGALSDREDRRGIPEARIIAITTYQGDADIHRALKRGLWVVT